VIATRRTTPPLLLVAVLGCSWDRFDALRQNTPVVELLPSAGMEVDFGATLAGLAAGDRTSVLVGSAAQSSGASVYLLGQDEDAAASAMDSNYCPASNDSRMCLLAAQPASLQIALSPSGRTRANCFVTGVGRAVTEVGLWISCEDTAEFTIPVPPDIQSEVVEPALAGSGSPDVVLASERASDSALVAGVGELSRAFYYEPNSTTPLDLAVAAGAPETFGAAVAVLATGSGRVLAVGAPGVAELHLFRTDGTGPLQLGCLAGPEGFGRTLAAGDFDGDGIFDLAVSDDADVRIFSGELISELPLAADAGCTVSLDSLLLSTLTCSNFGEARDCAGSRFGGALAIADFDGDGQAEVAVGAPRMTVRGMEDAGAVLVFDQAGDVVDARYTSTAGVGHLFGARLVALPQSDRDILAVTAPGAAAASVVYCATLAGSGNSPRCP
jgi:hypothetical protein